MVKKNIDDKNIIIGSRIRHIRNTKNLSMEKFGELFDPPASKGVVSNWENGYNLPNQERLKKIAEMGSMSIEELLYGTPIENLVNNTLEKAKEFTVSEKYLYSINMLKEFSSMNQHLKDMYEKAETEKQKENIYVAMEYQKDLVGAFFNTLLNDEERKTFEDLFINAEK